MSKTLVVEEDNISLLPKLVNENAVRKLDQRDCRKKYDGMQTGTPLSVLPEYQNKGIGLSLIKQGHTIAFQLGYL